MKSSPTYAIAALGLAAVTALAGCSSSDSSSDASSGADATALSMTECTQQGKVWLTVTTDQDQSLANQCVGNPDSGTAALEAAGLAIGRSSDGTMICTIGNYPDPCPATFTGDYWQYYTATPDGTWTYATTGADESKPAAGSIEGWCYGATCTPKLDGVNDPGTGDSTSTATAGSVVEVPDSADATS